VKPTGWTHGKGQAKETSLARLRIVTRGQISLLEVPYSEHSSYSELKRFLKFLRIKDVSQVVPTVNRRECRNMEGMFKQWIDERKKQGPDSQPIQIQKKQIQIDSQQMRKKEGLDSQQIQIDSQQIQRVLKQQSLVEAQEGQRRRSMDLLNPPCLANASLPQQQGEDVRNKGLLGVDQRQRVETNNSTCSVA